MGVTKRCVKMSEKRIQDITCIADAGHALQRKVKYFDLKWGGVLFPVHKKEERGAKNESLSLELD